MIEFAFHFAVYSFCFLGIAFIFVILLGVICGAIELLFRANENRIQKGRVIDMNKIRQGEILKSMYDLHLALLSMSDDEVEMFKQNNRHLISQLVQCLDEM